ncbi:MAG TPA: hypothetical protein VIY08_08640 [Candidatus Nitrosocosmicus sp.]
MVYNILCMQGVEFDLTNGYMFVTSQGSNTVCMISIIPIANAGIHQTV